MKQVKFTRRAALTTSLAAVPAAYAGGWLDSTTGVETEFFDPQYYANMNSDLLAANLLTYAQLRNHWNLVGKAEGRTTHPKIDPRSYLQRYADLRAAFGTNYAKAYDHYVTHGQFEEGRDASSLSLLCAKLGDVSIAASGRCQGAIDSMYFHGRETVNSFDHGRQVQAALYDTKYDACFNPTQAGRRSDGRGYASSSKLLLAQSLASGTGLRTKTQCAYWVGPNETITDAGVVPCTASNLTSVLSEFTVDTSYRLEKSGNVTLVNCLTKWVGNTSLPASRAQVVPVTGYHISDFSLGFEVVPENAYAARPRQIGDHLGNTGQERMYPTIFSTADGAHAIGVVGLPVVGAKTSYALYRWKFGQNQETNDASSWAQVNRYQVDVPAGKEMVSESIIVLGQVTDVHLKIRDILIARGITLS